MPRFASFMLFIPFVSIRSQDFSTCIEVLANSTECFDSNGVTVDYQNTDTTKCIACFASKIFLDGYDQSTVSCAEAKSDICGFLNQCQDACYPSVNVCQKEFDDYNSCFYGVFYAPDGCLVQCDGTTSDGITSDGSNNGGTINDGSNEDGSNDDGSNNEVSDDDEDDESNTNGGTASSSSMRVIMMISSSMLIAIVMVGNGLALSSL